MCKRYTNDDDKKATWNEVDGNNVGDDDEQEIDNVNVIFFGLLIDR